MKLIADPRLLPLKLRGQALHARIRGIYNPAELDMVSAGNAKTPGIFRILNYFQFNTFFFEGQYRLHIFEFSSG
jgi:hypothetical protein